MELQRACDIAGACLQVSEQIHRNSATSGTYHFVGASDVYWDYFALEIFNHARRCILITPISTRYDRTPAAWPLNCRMDCSEIEIAIGIGIPDWRVGFQRILDDLGVTA